MTTKPVKPATTVKPVVPDTAFEKYEKKDKKTKPAAKKKEGYRPQPMTDTELWNAVHGVLLKAVLHNRDITVEELTSETEILVKMIKEFAK